MSDTQREIDANIADLKNDLKKCEDMSGTSTGRVWAHVTPAINETCKHDWIEEETDEGSGPSHCAKCGLSFMRYIHCCMP